MSNEAAPGATTEPSIEQLAAEMIAVGCRRVHVLAWRDLDDHDAGGSEVHADHFMRRWAAAGLEITHRTSFAQGLPTHADRNGYHVVRKGSRYSVFLAVSLASCGPGTSTTRWWRSGTACRG